MNRRENANTIIKSFKHDGHLHRMWLENRRVPEERLHPEHAARSLIVTVNCRTPIREANGSEWVSKNPGVSFFIPGQWFNVVALIEGTGIRYYCNIASPPYLAVGVLTYIDYDLDVIMTPDGQIQVVDEDEYEIHKMSYHYPAVVQDRIGEGLKQLLALMEAKGEPFREQAVRDYYQWWLTEEQA